MKLPAEEMLEVRNRVRRVSKLFRLPFSRQNWTGTIGNWVGAGVGSSIDFQDHRPYVPGDDPRYIDWAAYARSGHYNMKLYREEVSPMVDLVLDCSASMALSRDKQLRTWELFYFCLDAVNQSGAVARCYLLCGSKIRVATRAQIETGDFDLPEPRADVPDLGMVPWRTGAMRLFLSDLLYGEAPAKLVAHLRPKKGRGIIFCPYARGEADPEWEGNMELVDCESGRMQAQYLDAVLHRHYRENYRRHFDFWQAECRKSNVVLTRVLAEEPLLEALSRQGVRTGAVELWT